MNIEFTIAQTLEELTQVLVVRGIVFCGEQNVPYTIERDQYEHCSIHILGKIKEEPAAAARVRFVDGFAKLERIAVRKEYRGHGFGHQLTDYMIQVAQKCGFYKYKMHAQSYLREFYACHKFAVRGEPFFEAEIEHVLMIRED